ncbi:MAG: hypothetical protein H3Z51_01420, partial [archaeon]|nr:hypothetical protein [archaeon]
MFTKVAIIGVGVMGKSITLAISLARVKVTLVTRRGKEGFDDFIKYFRGELKKGRIQLTEPDVYSLVDWSKKLEKGIGDADIVIETVIEDEILKKKLFKELDRLCPRETILASNTSSLSITEISGVTTRPERIIGLHFFNPAHIMKLVEVCPGKETSKETIEKALSFVEMLGKTPILVKDSPG